MVVPPGLVAASAVGQPGGAGGGGAAACRAWDWAPPPIATEPSAIFRAPAVPPGLRSVGAFDEPRSREIAVPVGETIELNIPAVCLNYGWPTPTPRDTFNLMTVEEYTQNPRIRKALRSLATYGTSLGVAQSVMWRRLQRPAVRDDGRASAARS